MFRSPLPVKAAPLATNGWGPGVFCAVRVVAVAGIAPGGRVRTSRPTPPTARTRFASLAIGWTRKASSQPTKLGPEVDSHTPPRGPTFQTRPCPVVPSPVQRWPWRSKARPFVPGTPVANPVAVGGVRSSGGSVQMTPPDPASATYRFPARSNVIPDGLQGEAAGLGRNPTTGRAGYLPDGAEGGRG